MVMVEMLVEFPKVWNDRRTKVDTRWRSADGPADSHQRCSSGEPKQMILLAKKLLKDEEWSSVLHVFGKKPAEVDMEVVELQQEQSWIR